MKSPTTSWPCSLRRAAATEESTPPDMATVMRMARILHRGKRVVRAGWLLARFVRGDVPHEHVVLPGAARDQFPVGGDRDRVDLRSRSRDREARLPGPGV